MLIDLRRLNGKADGVAGPATRAAIIDFEKTVGLRETGEASREVYVAALRAIAQYDAIARSPLPPPPRSEPRKAETPPPPPKPEPSAPPPTKIEAPPPPPKVDAPAPQPPKAETPAPPPRIDLGMTDPPPPPPTSAPAANVMLKTETPKPDPDAWPTKRNDQIRAIEALLGHLKLLEAREPDRRRRTAPISPPSIASTSGRYQGRGLMVPQTGEPPKQGTVRVAERSNHRLHPDITRTSWVPPGEPKPD